MDRGVVSPTLSGNPTILVTPCNFFWGGGLDLQYCIYYHLPSNISSKFQSSTKIFHPRLLTREGRVLGNGWTHPSSMTIFVHLFLRDVIRKSTIAMIGENRQLVTNEPVEVQDYRKITNHFREIYRIQPNLIKENRRKWTSNRLDFAHIRISTDYAQKHPQSLYHSEIKYYMALDTISNVVVTWIQRRLNQCRNDMWHG